MINKNDYFKFETVKINVAAYVNGGRYLKGVIINKPGDIKHFDKLVRDLSTTIKRDILHKNGYYEALQKELKEQEAAHD